MENTENTENKKLILDFSKWRSGGAECDKNKNLLGKGPTMMKNNEGFSCCLGLFSPQLEESVTDEFLLGAYGPSETSKKIGKVIPLLVEVMNGDLSFMSTPLTGKAIVINDNSNTTPEEKIEALKELFGEKGYKIEVINSPSH